MTADPAPAPFVLEGHDYLSEDELVELESLHARASRAEDGAVNWYWWMSEEPPFAVWAGQAHETEVGSLHYPADAMAVCELHNQFPRLLADLRIYRARVAADTWSALELVQARLQKDAAYTERNLLAAALAVMASMTGLESWLGHDDAPDPEMDGFRTVLYIKLPQGQISFHLPDQLADLLRADQAVRGRRGPRRP